MGALEVGLAAQVQCAEESMSEIEFWRLWVEGELKEQATISQVEEQMGNISVHVRDLEIKERNSGLSVSMRRLEDWAIEWGYLLMP